MDSTIVTFVSAAVGSTGVVGLATALIGRARSSRLRRFIDDAAVTRPLLPEGGSARAMLDQSVQIAALRMAATNLNQAGPAGRFGVQLAVVAMSLLVALSATSSVFSIAAASDQPTRVVNTVSGFVFFLLYILVATLTVVFAVRVGAERLMAEQLVKLSIVVETPEVKRARKEIRRVRRLRRKVEVTHERSVSRRLARLRARRHHESKLGQEPAAVTQVGEHSLSV